MSYKPIDLQTSLPRVMELSPMQQHQQQRSAAEQTLQGQQAMKTAEQQAHRSAKTESASKGTISDRDSRGRNGEGSTGKRQEGEPHSEEGRSSVAEHPYKGKHIDFIG